MEQAVKYLDESAAMTKKIKNILVPNLIQFVALIALLIVGTLVAIPAIENVFEQVGSQEVMVVDNVVAGCIRKEKFSVSELEDSIQGNLEKGNISLINSIAKLFVEEKITLEQAKSQIEEKNIEVLNRTIMQMKMKRG